MKVYLRTFGCRANQYDTEAVRELVEAGGHAVVDDVGDADAAVFNSCAVTAAAEAELRKAVRRTARLRPGIQSIVMGCASALDASRAPDLRIASLPSVSDVVAGADLEQVARALGIADAPVALRTRAQSGTRGLLRVQDGCDEHCTFCATTLARGANRSRPVPELVDEASVLAERHAEIVITGIHIGTYGADAGTSLGHLMERLVRDVPRVRFRLSSVEATEVDERIAELFAGAPDRLAPHLHAPLQSGSDRLLKRMGRHWYTSATYSAAIERLAARMSIFGLGADIITGFPGETEDDYQATLALVERLPFTHLHVFPFSPRPGSAAVRLPDPVAPAIADRRAAELRDLAERKARQYAEQRAGGAADVVVIGSTPKRRGLTGDYLSVAVSDPTLARGARFSGRLTLDGAGLRVTSDTVDA